ncbi:aminoglycoside phosphotransferase family protein [Kribbella antibiotica]|uniref:Aminoglycoside phosphotransferase family protein n=1 Tax=Kribbella antibiotica TaxID=190195 RepID=A0A4R4ZJB4_9ACTN|nr:aminoglycoside phosphotransferase family protein [Kribbella antibiotica]TDD58713.1 aminoglycoside phosphotransferase family protein [Kribbella antibiotica]
MDVEPAVAVAKAIASAADAIVLNASNKVILRLLPNDVVARVALADEHGFEQELELGRHLAEGGYPAVAPADPKVYEQDGISVSFWRYYEPQAPIPPAEFAAALQRLHEGMREVDVPTPHFMDRVVEATYVLANPALSPEATEADRDLVVTTLTRASRAVLDAGAPEQLLHGEPHPGNLLSTTDGPLFIDWETVCRGPVEFDIAHAPEEIAAHYPGIDPELVRQCRLLMLAIVIAWRWELGDQLPNGNAQRAEFTAKLRAELSGN